MVLLYHWNNILLISHPVYLMRSFKVVDNKKSSKILIDFLMLRKNQVRVFLEIGFWLYEVQNWINTKLRTILMFFSKSCLLLWSFDEYLLYDSRFFEQISYVSVVWTVYKYWIKIMIELCVENFLGNKSNNYCESRTVERCIPGTMREATRELINTAK